MTQGISAGCVTRGKPVLTDPAYQTHAISKRSSPASPAARGEDRRRGGVRRYGGLGTLINVHSYGLLYTPPKPRARRNLPSSLSYVHALPP
ncbi:hypothetical protein SKAU_G00147370 [Synaphobranchus kaupii]|uniref:Uncharacterized protein n=1 Tax=Synaphobranchus kaupii TaxID=118154 RepID=A0A9Q1FTD6_SYNKA|nr:hypothetical protein SKAU_G00147370 [Synaphobranchus kaupii]